MTVVQNITVVDACMSGGAACQAVQHAYTTHSTHSAPHPRLPDHAWARFAAATLQADHQLALLQHGTRLYLVNTAAISRDLFYQLLLTRWEGLAVMQLAQPLHVGTLMGLALEQEEAAGRWQVGIDRQGRREGVNGARVYVSTKRGGCGLCAY